MLLATVKAQVEVPEGFTVETVCEGLDAVVTMDVARDGRIFICEQTGAVRVVKDGRLLEEPFLRIAVDDFWERGVTGVALHPRFPGEPMFFDEAVLQIEMSNCQFVVFLSAKTEKINVLRRRKDGGFGLMEPVSAQPAASRSRLPKDRGIQTPTVIEPGAVVSDVAFSPDSAAGLEREARWVRSSMRSSACSTRAERLSTQSPLL